MRDPPRNALTDLKILVALWLATSLLSFLFVGLDIRSTNRRVRLILADPGETVGRWTLKACENHASREFTFHVDGKAYTGDEGPEADDCDAVKLGASVNVVYQRKNPSNNFGGRMNELPQIVEFGAAGFMIPFLWVILVFLIFVLPQLRRVRSAARSFPSP